MSFERPTLRQLVDRLKNDVDARLPGADSRLSRSALGALATTAAGAAHGLYGYLDYLADEILPDTASEYLDRHASIWGVTRKVATLASGTATATGVNGAVIPQGTILQRAGGLEYATQTAVSIAGGVATLPLAALTPGVAPVADGGTKLTFVSPIAGVAALAVVDEDGLRGGAAEESDELLRERLLSRIRQRPEGGAVHDYVLWATEVAEVTRAWPLPGWMGAGTVGLAFMMDGRVDPIPLEADVEAVQAYVGARAPVTADLIVFAPTPAPMAIEINGLSPNNAAVRAAVAAEIEDLLFREARPGGTILISHLRAAISQAAGEYDHVLVSPIANVVHAANELAVLGAIDWGD